MAKLTKFSYNSAGQLAYRNTGALAPADYTVRGSTVYGRDGRRIGTVGKGTAAQRAKVERAARNRRAFKKGESVKYGGRMRPVFKNIEAARKAAGGVLYKPVVGPTDAARFKKGVENMAFLSYKDDPETYRKIKAMDASKLSEMYNSGSKAVFEVYFDYGDVGRSSMGTTGGRQTAENARYLVAEYEKRYGAIVI